MLTIAEEFARIASAKAELKNAFSRKGVFVPDSARLDDYPALMEGVVGETASDNYARPADRPEVPPINPNEIYILFGIGKEAPNDYAINITCVGGYTVDWGDGVTDNWASAATCEHQYDYNAASTAPDSRGYKLVWIKITPQGANPITVINLHVRPSPRAVASASNIFVPQVFEMYVNTPALTTMTWGTSTTSHTRYRMLEIFSYEGAVLSGATYFLEFCSALRVFYGVEYVGATIYFMYSCMSYNQPFPEGTTFTNATTYFMVNCYAYNQPFPQSVTFKNVSSSFMNNCYSYNKPFPQSVTFENVTSSFMNNCYRYNQPFPQSVTFESSTSSFMNNCYAYNQTTTIHLQNTTAIGASSPGAFNYAQKGLRLIGMGTVHTAINVANSSMGREALVALFGDLYDRTGTTAGTLTITGCTGTASLSAEDKTIATDKNWTLVT